MKYSMFFLMISFVSSAFLSASFESREYSVSNVQKKTSKTDEFHLETKKGVIKEFLICFNVVFSSKLKPKSEIDQCKKNLIKDAQKINEYFELFKKLISEMKEDIVVTNATIVDLKKKKTEFEKELFYSFKDGYKNIISVLSKSEKEKNLLEIKIKKTKEILVFMVSSALKNLNSFFVFWTASINNLINKNLGVSNIQDCIKEIKSLVNFFHGLECKVFSPEDDFFILFNLDEQKIFNDITKQIKNNLEEFFGSLDALCDYFVENFVNESDFRIDLMNIQKDIFGDTGILARFSSDIKNYQEKAKNREQNFRNQVTMKQEFSRASIQENISDMGKEEELMPQPEEAFLKTKRERVISSLEKIKKWLTDQANKTKNNFSRQYIFKTTELASFDAIDRYKSLFEKIESTVLKIISDKIIVKDEYIQKLLRDVDLQLSILARTWEIYFQTLFSKNKKQLKFNELKLLTSSEKAILLFFDNVFVKYVLAMLDVWQSRARFPLSYTSFMSLHNFFNALYQE